MNETKTVIYNGACPICSREVAGYRRLAEEAGAPLAFADLNDTDLAAHGLTHEAAARRFHVLADGQLLSGVDAFAALWRAIPRLAWLARLVETPIVRPLARFGYDRLAAPALYALHRRRERRQARLAP